MAPGRSIAPLRHLAAIFIALLPKRVWDNWDLPVENVVLTSSILTFFSGATLGITGYFQSMQRTVEGAAWTPPPLMIAFFLTYVFATPRGLFSVYLVASAFLRVASWWIGEPAGDPILTGIDTLVRRTRRSHLDRRSRAAREELEGADEPDRLYDGHWAGVPDATYVVVAARRKADWTKGTWVITRDGWFTLGEPFDRPMPQGVRTIYPITLQTNTLDVLRKGVSYELPPLRESRRHLPRTGDSQQ